MSDIQQKRPFETTDNVMTRLAAPYTYYCPICHENAISYPDVKFCETCIGRYIEDVDGGIELIIKLTEPTRKESETMSKETKSDAGLWRKNPETPEGKYLVKRRDGSIPEWPSLVIGARDPAAPYALLAYADAAEALGMNPRYVADMRILANEFEQYRLEHGDGDPDKGKHRIDDPKIIEEMRSGHSS